LLACGAVIDACDAIMKKQATNAFCAVRPPGHHAGVFGKTM
jgi:acetoin utilization deacetylase AcuC-like enzyme